MFYTLTSSLVTNLSDVLGGNCRMRKNILYSDGSELTTANIEKNKSQCGCANNRNAYNEDVRLNNTPNPEESLNYSDYKYLIHLLGDIDQIVEPLSVTGQEAISHVYSYHVLVRTRAATSEMMSHIGSDLAVKISVGDEVRYIHGIIASIARMGFDSGLSNPNNSKTYAEDSVFLIEIKPLLHSLQGSEVYWVHAEKSALEIVFNILKKYNIKYSDEYLNRKKSAQSITRVQYGQSDYDFIDSILRDESVFYCFEHNENGHVMTFYDDITRFVDLGAHAYNPVPFYGKSLSKLNQKHAQTPLNVKVDGYHFENNEYIKIEGRQSINPGMAGKYVDTCKHINTMVSDKAVLEQYLSTQVRQLSIGTERSLITSYSPELMVGKRFSLHLNGKSSDIEKNYYISEAKTKIVLNKISNVEAYTEFLYAAVLNIHCSNIPFYPPERKQLRKIYDNISAIIVGPDEGMLHADKYGRVQIRFLWQLADDSSFDSKKYCWARVNQFWNGANFGGQFLPRVGTEVIVTFMGGNPDYPVIMGCLYNGQCMPTFDLDDTEFKSCSGIQTHSMTDGNNAHGHRLCFQDKQDEEYVELHSQRDLHINSNNDTNIIVEHDLNMSVRNGDYAIEINEGSLKVNGKNNIDIVSLSKITLRVAESKIVITPDEIQIIAPQIAAEAEMQASLKACNTVIKGSAELELSSVGLVKIQGEVISLN